MFVERDRIHIYREKVVIRETEYCLYISLQLKDGNGVGVGVGMGVGVRRVQQILSYYYIYY